MIIYALSKIKKRPSRHPVGVSSPNRESADEEDEEG